MPSVNEALRDGEIGHQVNLSRYSNGVVRRFIALLNRVDPDLLAKLTAAIDALEGEPTFAVERLDALLFSVRTINAQAYQAAGLELRDELRNLTDHEAGFQLRLFRSELPELVKLAETNPEQVYGAAMARPFQGRLLSEWASSIEADRMARIRDAIRIGIVENQTTPQIVQRIKGTRANGYADGLLEIDRRNAEAVVRTAVSHVAAFTRDRFYQANNDLIKAVVWLSTLDTRTTVICQLRDGKEYTNDTHRPIGHSYPWLGGPGAAHWNAITRDTLITTSRGEVPIQEVRVGDSVLTHRGRFRPVSDVHSKLCESGVVRAAYLQSGRVLRATDDHPIATAAGWKFMGALEVGEQLFGDSEGLEIVGGRQALVGTKSKDRPTCVDSTGVSLLRTLQLVATAVNLECKEKVGAREIEDHVFDLMLRNPEWIEDECSKHHLLSMADALKKLGRNGLSDLLFDMIGDFGSAQSIALSFVEAAGNVGLCDPFNHTIHSDRVIGTHAIGVQSHGSVSVFGMAPRPMSFPGLRDATPTFKVKQCLLLLGSNGNLVSAGARRKASVRQSFGSLDVAERSASADMLLKDERSEDRIFFAHDRIIALEVQNYNGTVFDLEIQGDASYVAAGIVVSNCRSSSLAVTKSYRDLGINMDELPPGSRASMDGQVPGETTFADWLRRQSAARQDEILGPTRGKLMRDGGLTLDRFANDKGRWYSLEQLRAIDDKAFAKAGL